MEVIKITDLPDGGADVLFEITKEEQEIFVKYALLDILKKSAEYNLPAPLS